MLVGKCVARKRLCAAEALVAHQPPAFFMAQLIRKRLLVTKLSPVEITFFGIGETLHLFPEARVEGE
ncbi:MAG: hypothetical protein COA70_03720 [Planctomycetota bacterium]|nr:MAG: hypothetical protein COA70_03720 [Planctomycetota bacterium]